MKLTVEEWPTTRLIEYARNPRKNDDQVDRMCAAIREFGFRIPIVAKSDGLVVDGHLRLKAARKLGLEVVPVALADDLTDAQIKAFRLLANKSAEWASWDMELLQLEVQELAGDGFDLGLVGFDEVELALLMADHPGGNTDPDDVPATPEIPVTMSGDVWVMGRHRLVCGDCTDKAAVAKVLNGVAPHLMVTDPPYGVDYNPGWRDRDARKWPGGMGSRVIGGTALGLVSNDARADWSDAWALFGGDVAYVWHAALYSGVALESMERHGWMCRSQIIWVKNQMVIGRGQYHWQHEPCWYMVRKSKTGHWQGDRKQTTAWQIDKPRKSETGHSTQKPVECMKRPIENNSSPGLAVYEPFSGSGTTILAAEMTARSCLAIEIAPEYCDVAVLRWQDFSGKEAILESTGQTFASVALDRGRLLPARPLAGDAGPRLAHP